MAVGGAMTFEAALLAAGSVDRLAPVLALLASAAVALVVFRRRPVFGLALWLVSLGAVPIWVGAGVASIFIPVSAGLAYLLAVSLVRPSRYRFSPVDGLVVALLTLNAASVVLGGGSVALSSTVSFVVFAMSGYLLGRMLSLTVEAQTIYTVLTVALTGVAVLAIVEFVSGANLFVAIPGDAGLRSVWSPLQLRGGLLRAEGAFGHSIALGACLAIAIPLALMSRLRMWVRLASVAVMLTAVVLTFSRIAMVTAVLGLALTLIFQRSGLSVRARSTAVALLALAGAVAVPVVTSVFQDAGSEAAGSAGYRGDLLSLVSTMNVIGVSDAARVGVDGTLRFGAFRSIDSQLVLTGLTSGLLALLLVTSFLIAAAVLTWRGRASAATLAIVAQIPALAAVASITQYSILFWVVVGVAATTQTVQRGTGPKAPGYSNTSSGESADGRTVTTSLSRLPSGTLKR